MLCLAFVVLPVYSVNVKLILAFCLLRGSLPMLCIDEFTTEVGHAPHLGLAPDLDVLVHVLFCFNILFFFVFIIDHKYIKEEGYSNNLIYLL